MKIASIDPGQGGSLYINNKIPLFLDFKEVGIRGYAEALHKHKPDIVVVERVHSMPGQGVASMFSFGQRFGELIGMLITLNMEYELVQPRKWQRDIGVEPKSGKQGVFDIVSKTVDKSLLTGPRGGIKDGRCDALGINLYKQKAVSK